MKWGSLQLLEERKSKPNRKEYWEWTDEDGWLLTPDGMDKCRKVLQLFRKAKRELGILYGASDNVLSEDIDGVISELKMVLSDTEEWEKRNRKGKRESATKRKK